MTTPADAHVIAHHWPAIDRSIRWQQSIAQRRALNILAREQFANGGFPVPLGRKHLTSTYVLTQGEASGILDALADLRGRGVVSQRIGMGSSASCWSLEGDITRWRRIRWIESSRRAEALISLCICVGQRAVVTEFPDGEDDLRRSSLENRHFIESDHQNYWILPVELRHNRERPDANAQNAGGEPVELRRNRAAENSLYHSFGSSKEELSNYSAESNYESHRLYRAAAQAVTRPGFKGKFLGDLRDRLVKLILTWNDDQVDQAVQWLNEGRARGRDLGWVTVLEDLEGFPSAPAWPRSNEMRA